MYLLLLLVIISIIYTIYLIKRVQANFELLEGISDDINEIRMKLRLGIVYRTEEQRKRYIKELVERCLILGKGIEEIKEIKDYCFPKRHPYDISTEESRKKYDKFIRKLIKDFEEAKICPQCKQIYYNSYVIDLPFTHCVNCKTSDNKDIELITTAEYKQRISGK